MKKNGQLAAKSKINAVQANKKNTPAKGPAMKAKKPQQARGAKNVGKKLLVSSKNGKKPNSEDDEEDSDDDSGADLEISAQNIADNIEESDDDAEVDEEDSDSDEDEEEADDNDEPEEKPFKKMQIKEEDSDEDEDEEDGDDNSGADEVKIEKQIKQETDSEDEAPVKKQSKKASKTPSTKETAAVDKACKIYVKRLDKDATEDDLKQHFASCGKIEKIKIFDHGRRAEAMIIFADADASRAALKLHNTILKDATILVHHATIDRARMDKDHSVLILNVDGLKKLEGEKLEKILSKCGEIDAISVVCEKNILAFVTFKDTESVKKALKLDGTTQGGIQLKVSPYTGKAPKTKIFVKNIDNRATEAEVREMFEACGPIQKIVLRQNEKLPTTAVIIFENQESYCQSFLLHEEKLRGRPLSLLPFSEHPNNKRDGFQKKNFQKTPFKGKRPQSGMWKNGPPAKKTKK